MLAYADSLAAICRNKQELDREIDLLDNWATENEIAVKKKKSRIFVIDNDRNNMHQHKGYPVKVTFKQIFGDETKKTTEAYEGLEDKEEAGH